MKTLNLSKKVSILLCLVIVFIFISYYFVYSDIKRRNEHVSSLNQDLSFQIKKRQYILSLQRTFQSTDSDIALVNNSIIPTEDGVKFIEDIESMARNNGLTIDIDSLGFEDSTLFSSSTITTLKVRAKTTGSWGGTYHFLSEIESLPIKVKINNLGLLSSIKDDGSTSKTKKPTALWQSTFEINVLKYK